MEKTGFLGIDVSKGYADFVIMDENRYIQEKGFRLDDTKEGRHKLKEIIKGWFSSGLKELWCGVESTGGYENNWYYTLQLMGMTSPIKVARLNPKAVKSNGDAELSRTITDQISAKHIASYLTRYPEKIVYAKGIDQAENYFKEGRQFKQFVQLSIKQKVQLSNQLEKIMYQYFSEAMIYCRHGFPLWLLNLLCIYPTAQSVVKAGLVEVSKVKGIGSKRATSVMEKSKKAEQRPCPIASQHLIQSLARQILHQEELIAREKKFLVQQYCNHPHVKLLQSCPGIGAEGAVEILLEIEDINRFEQCKKLCAYFGVHPTYKQSGDGTWNVRMCKKGRSAIRARLYMIALGAIRNIDSIKKLYHRKRSEGKNHYQAMGVLMHKMLRIIYGILKSEKPFDEKIDQQNIQNAEALRMHTKQKQTQLDQKPVNSKFRHQIPDLEAPISRKAAKKRKEQMASQFKVP